MKRFVTTAMAAAFVVPAGMAAQETADLPQEVTDGFYVTVEEIRANSRELFDTFAGPDGGPVTADEFVSTDLPDEIVPDKPEGRMLERLFELLDANDDDRLTRAEWDRRIDSDLEFADEDEDGRITLKELANARENLGFGEAMGMIF